MGTGGRIVPQRIPGDRVRMFNNGSWFLASTLIVVG